MSLAAGRPSRCSSIGIVILLLQFMQPVLIPLVLGALLFYALDPAVDWLERTHVPRAIGAALMLLIVLSACGALAYSLQGQALTVIDELPPVHASWPPSLRKTPGIAARRARKSATGCRCSAVGGQACAAEAGRASRAGPGRRFRASSVRMVELDRPDVGGQPGRDGGVPHLLHAAVGPTLQAKARGDRRHGLAEEDRRVLVLDDIAGQIEQFIKIQLVTSAAVALVTWGALWSLGLEQAALWGLLAGIFNSIPVLRTTPGDRTGFQSWISAVRHDRHDRSGRRRLAARSPRVEGCC